MVKIWDLFKGYLEIFEYEVLWVWEKNEFRFFKFIFKFFILNNFFIFLNLFFIYIRFFILSYIFNWLENLINIKDLSLYRLYDIIKKFFSKWLYIFYIWCSKIVEIKYFYFIIILYSIILYVYEFIFILWNYICEC